MIMWFCFSVLVGLTLLFWRSRKKSKSYTSWAKILSKGGAIRRSRIWKKNGAAARQKGSHPLAETLLQSQKVSGPAEEPVTGIEGEAFSHLELCVKRIEKQFLPRHNESVSPLLGETLIDQRVFWDCFRQEIGAFVMLYHVDQMKVIFVSSSIKKLLGILPGDFRIRFHEILHDVQAWKKALYQLKWRKRLYAPLAFKNMSSGRGLCAWDAYLAEIDRGPGLQYVAVVLYPAYCYLPRPPLVSY